MENNLSPIIGNYPPAPIRRKPASSTVNTPSSTNPTKENKHTAPEEQKLTPAQQWTRSVARLVLECLNGLRRIQRYDRWITSSACDALTGYRKAWVKTYGEKSHLVKLGKAHASSPAPGVLECWVSYSVAGRTRALALRLEQGNKQWVLSAVEV
ncbi:hypothetical protein KRX54_06665 [Actinomycetaceae bacterium TAE3-ERU4]|nr:hypothetical protein [Actinomycetaceae bacterium TAE3-ERU4]